MRSVCCHINGAINKIINSDTGHSRELNQQLIAIDLNSFPYIHTGLGGGVRRRKAQSIETKNIGMRGESLSGSGGVCVTRENVSSERSLYRYDDARFSRLREISPIGLLLKSAGRQKLALATPGVFPATFGMINKVRWIGRPLGYFS